MLGGDGTKVIGSALKNNLFGAAYEYTKRLTETHKYK